MKKIKTLIIIFALLLLPTLANAQTSQLFNFQGVLVDNGGNVLYEVQEADIVFSIVDGAGAVLFSERQHVPIVSGAISVLVGNGDRISGDDLLNVFAADGDKILRVQLDDHTIPQEDVQIVSVPYAMVAERLSSDITTAEIANGTIEQEDLSETLLNYIDNLTGLTEGDLNAHRSESGAHAAVSISVENTFVNMPGTSLQQILQGIDTAIGIRTNQDGVLEATKVGKSGDTMTGDLSFDDATCLATPGLEHNCQVDGVDVSAHAGASSAVHGVTGTVVGTTDAQTLSSKTLQTPTIRGATFQNATGNPLDVDINASNDITTSGGTITDGTLNMQRSNIEMLDDGCEDDQTRDCLTVDRVDVSFLQDRVADLEGADIGPGDIPAAIRPLAYGRCLEVPGDDTVTGTYNITATNDGTADCDGNMIYNFNNTPSSDNYVVQITPHEICGSSCSKECRVSVRDSSYFKINCNTEAGYDFLVFYNPN